LPIEAPPLLELAERLLRFHITTIVCAFWDFKPFSSFHGAG
jgi:hypothetical protein